MPSLKRLGKLISGKSTGGKSIGGNSTRGKSIGFQKVAIKGAGQGLKYLEHGLKFLEENFS